MRNLTWNIHTLFWLFAADGVIMKFYDGEGIQYKCFFVARGRIGYLFNNVIIYKYLAKAAKHISCSRSNFCSGCKVYFLVV